MVVAKGLVWMSTAEDLYLFAKAYLNEKLLPSKWMNVQITNDHTLADSIPDSRFGLHVVRAVPKNSFVIGHNGGGKGFSVDVYRRRSVSICKSLSQ